jgi:hypothetical protein
LNFLIGSDVPQSRLRPREFFLAIVAQLVELSFVLVTRLKFLGQAPDRETNAASLELRSSEISRVDRYPVHAEVILERAGRRVPERSQLLGFL